MGERSLADIVTAGFRLAGVKEQKPQLRPLPTFDSGAKLVDIADRDALYPAMEPQIVTS